MILVGVEVSWIKSLNIKNEIWRQSLRHHPFSTYGKFTEI